MQTLKVDEVLGQRYKIVSQVGEGGFGAVYLVENSGGDFFALKTIQADKGNEDNALSRFRLECAIWSEMKHQNIVAVESVDEFLNRLCLIIEYVPPNSLNQNTLRHYIRYSSPTVHQILLWTIQLCSGMSHAYCRGLICHRDLKPENLLITPSGVLKITDFGISRIAETSELLTLKSEPNKSNLTQGIIGTLSYLSPEQIFDPQSVDQLSDIYSFGIVLYEVVSGGGRPFNILSTNDETEAFLEKMLSARHAMEVRPLSSPLWPLVVSCLNFERSQRPTSFGDIKAECCRLLRKLYGQDYIEPTEKDLSVADLNKRAGCHFQLGNYERMRFYVEEALRVDPENLHVRHNIGLLELLGRNYSEARTQFEKAVRLGKDRAETWVNLGISNRKLGNIDEAIISYLTALDIDSACLLAWYNLGMCFGKAQRLKDGLQALDCCLQIDPNFAQAWIVKGNFHIDLLQYDLAVLAFRSALDLNSLDIELWFRLGTTLQKLGKFEEAIDAYGKVIKSDNDHINANFSLALVHAQLGEKSSALEHFSRFLLLSPTNDFSRRSIANAYLASDGSSRDITTARSENLDGS